MDAGAHAALDGWGIAWRLGLTLFFVVLNGFFVAAEFSLVKVRASRIEELAAAGSRSARSVQHILKHLDRYLSACQLGITIASLILGALGEPAVSVLIVAAANYFGIGVTSEAPWLPFISIGLAFALITMLHMTLGEQAPKMWALRRAEVTSLQTSLILRPFTAALLPFIWAVNAISNWMLRLVGLPRDAHHGDEHTAEEIRSILSVSARSGHITEHELELTENVFRMISLEVRHIIVPRVDVDFLSLERTRAENIQAIRDSRHSRLPLCEKGLDSVVGFVHAKDALEKALDTPDLDLRQVAREPVFVPDTMSVSDFLRELQSHRAHCALVLDEHGTAIGLAFREDALEEIVGPLGDEFDDPEWHFRESTDGSHEVAGRMSLPEVCDRLGFELDPLEDEAEDTIGGHVTARLGRLAKRGDQVSVGPFDATVTDVSRRRVHRLRMVRRAIAVLDPAASGSEAAAAETPAEAIENERNS